MCGKLCKGPSSGFKINRRQFGTLNFREWRSILELYERIPERTLLDILKISYGCLQDGAKGFFLDIARFFKEEDLESVEEKLAAYDFGASFYVEVLVDKSLITVADNGNWGLHNLRQQMGREIVRQGPPSNPCKRSRLWHYEDVPKVLRENLGSSNNEGIMLDPSQQEEVEWSSMAFETMSTLRILCLIRVHDSVGPLSKLVELDLRECSSLTSFSREIKMASLRKLHPSYCRSLDYFPCIVGKMNALRAIYAEGTAIKELPLSIGNLPRLESLAISSHKSIRELPSGLFTLQNLGWFNLSGSDFVSLPECIKECANLQTLVLYNCKRLRDIPELPWKLANIEAEDCTSLTTESLGHLWDENENSPFILLYVVFKSENTFGLVVLVHQARKEFSHLNITMPLTTFPDWFNECCKGGTLSFEARGNFPHAAFAFELGKANTSSKHLLHVSVSVNEEWERLDSFLELDWNDVEIEVLSLIPRKRKKVIKLTPEMPVVSCGVYAYKQQTNMENVRFSSTMPSLNAPRTSLKQRAVTSPPNEPPKKSLGMFKVADYSITKKGIR
ncbi:disease resistance protein RML1A-like [Neltuma alba]|uniref:disease resistance protein RML1A-like n=1 Tax=Neltuma alba TaxID=207710 RepID=UPI0010A4C2E2|nr:disease resistance protein RML1A-like [Prosopis alba]